MEIIIRYEGEHGFCPVSVQAMIGKVIEVWCRRHNVLLAETDVEVIIN